MDEEGEFSAWQLRAMGAAVTHWAAWYVTIAEPVLPATLDSARDFLMEQAQL